MQGDFALSAYWVNKFLMNCLLVVLNVIELSQVLSDLKMDAEKVNVETSFPSKCDKKISLNKNKEEFQASTKRTISPTRKNEQKYNFWCLSYLHYPELFNKPIGSQ